MATVVRVSLDQLQTESLVAVRVNQTEYQFRVGRVKSWFHPDTSTAVDLVQGIGELWMPWPPPHSPTKWVCPLAYDAGCGEIVFCLEGATDEAIAAAKVCEAEFSSLR